MAVHETPAGEATLSNLLSQVEARQNTVEQQARRDRVREQAFERLYQELEQYKDDFIFQNEKPLLLDLLLFHDSLKWFRESLLSREMSLEVVSDNLQYMIDEFLELLYRRDVIPMEPKERFDRAAQKAIKVSFTPDRDMDCRVERVVKRGFTRAGRVLRVEEVIVQRYRQDALPDNNGEQG